MPLSAERLIQCEAAKRFIADPHFNALLDRIAKEATHNAVFLAEAPEADAAATLHSQSME